MASVALTLHANTTMLREHVKAMNLQSPDSANNCHEESCGDSEQKEKHNT